MKGLTTSPSLPSSRPRHKGVSPVPSKEIHPRDKNLTRICLGCKAKCTERKMSTKGEALLTPIALRQSESNLRNLQNARSVGLQQHCTSSGFEAIAASHSTAKQEVVWGILQGCCKPTDRAFCRFRRLDSLWRRDGRTERFDLRTRRLHLHRASVRRPQSRLARPSLCGGGFGQARDLNAFSAAEREMQSSSRARASKQKRSRGGEV